jgi:hypothetical protein
MAIEPDLSDLISAQLVLASLATVPPVIKVIPYTSFSGKMQYEVAETATFKDPVITDRFSRRAMWRKLLLTDDSTQASTDFILVPIFNL